MSLESCLLLAVAIRVDEISKILKKNDKNYRYKN